MTVPSRLWRALRPRCATRRRLWHVLGALSLALGVLLSGLAWQTWRALQPFPTSLTLTDAPIRKMQVLDRRGLPLSVTFHNPWNVHDVVPLHAIPDLLQRAFIAAEDQRFAHHGGVDWWARVHALWQNVRAWRKVRGASTITEQVVRLLHPRPRTVWSRWVEGFEAVQLEARFAKATLLEFYLNQVPYARQRRGIVQAARMYFDRDLDTLSPQEMLTLAVLVRAPSRLDVLRTPTAIAAPLAQLAARLHAEHVLTTDVYQQIVTQPLRLRAPELPVEASHFVRYVHQQAETAPPTASGRVQSTLDATLQRQARALLDSRLRDLRTQGVTHGALLVVEHQNNEVLAWANAGGSQIDAVLAPRQPGSTLKPFVYGLAFTRGWTAATLVEDRPLDQPIGAGLHAFRNYSGQHYGALRVREALGNSLNVPAVRAIDFVGNVAFLQHLHHLGFASLRESADYYGNGLVLGNGEVTLFELVQAYATLARQGVAQPVRVVREALPQPTLSQRVYSPEVSTLLAHILADPEARLLEFGRGNLLRFPVETAVKTGTSSDYRDAWAVGFSHRYTAGVWLGNLQQRPMHDVTGSFGPALVLRALFAELHRDTETHPLPLSSHLTPVAICRVTGQRAGPDCPSMREWFLPNTAPEHDCPRHQPTIAPRPVVATVPGAIRLVRPTHGLHLAMDPRIPDALEVFPFLLSKDTKATRVEWVVDGQLVGTTARYERQFLWHVSRGTHSVHARVWQDGQDTPITTPPVEFVVK